MTMADRIAVMDKGRIVQVATPAEIYEAPASRFIADFVGTVNMFEGKVTAREYNVATIDSGNGFVIRADNAGEAKSGSTVWFAVRPEKIRVSSKRPENAGLNAAEGEVWDIAYLGDMTLYHVRLDDGRMVRTSLINSERTTQDPLSWHDRAWISFQPDAGVVLTS
jgi:putrescine transport system ATP-binding protein